MRVTAMEKKQPDIESLFDEFEKLLKRHCTCLSDWQLFYEMKKKYLGGERDDDLSGQAEAGAS